MIETLRTTKRLLLICLSLLTLTGMTLAQSRPFITVWDSNLYGNHTERGEIYLPAEGEYSYSYESIDNPAINGQETATGRIRITFPVPGIYRMEITPRGPIPFHRIEFLADAFDSHKLLRIEQWGDVEWSGFESAFTECYNLEITATDIPNLSRVRSMKRAFDSAISIKEIPGMN